MLRVVRWSGPGYRAVQQKMGSSSRYISLNRLVLHQKIVCRR